MDFYRARRNAEIKSDGFVRQALGQALEDVLLARRESRDEASRIGRPARPAFGIGKALKGGFDGRDPGRLRSEEHTSELQSLMRLSYAVFFLHKNIRNSQI